jgi:hypothetical protein
MAKGDYPGYSQAYQYLVNNNIEVEGRGGKAPSEAYVKRVYGAAHRQIEEGRTFDRSLARGHKQVVVKHPGSDGGITTKNGKKHYNPPRPEQYSVGTRQDKPFSSDVAKLLKKIGKKQTYQVNITGIPGEGSGGDKTWEPGDVRTYGGRVSGKDLQAAAKAGMSIEQLAHTILPYGWTEVFSVSIVS